MEQQTQQSVPNNNIAIVILGYGFCLLSFLLLPIVFMPIAILMGITCMFTNNWSHGMYIIFIAIVLGCISAHIGGWGLGLPKL